MDESPGASLDEALGAKTYEWQSKDGSYKAVFGKPRGVVSPLISSVLGSANADNQEMIQQARALLGLRSFKKPTDPGLKAVVPFVDLPTYQRTFGLFGDDEEADERFQWYTLCFSAKTSPEFAALLQRSADENDGRMTEDIKRQFAEAGLIQVKGSPALELSADSSGS